jgi:hypothetical protein
MYGIVNQAIKGLVTENYGKSVWQEVKVRSGVKAPNFMSRQSYDDNVTFELAIVTSEVLETPINKVLFLLGEYWILKTGLQYYGLLMQDEGNNLKDFLVNLPNFNNRIRVMYPNISPPEFKIKEIGDKNIELHYYSTREGLTDFMHGLISGMGKMYNEIPNIHLKNSRSNGLDHDEFTINW